MTIHRPIPARPAEFDWDRPFEARYRFMRVDRLTRLEVAEVRGVTGGSIARNADSSIRESARLDVDGTLGLGPDWLRVYLDAVPVGSSDVVTECLGTFTVARAPRVTDGDRSTSSPDLYGLLHIAEASGPRGTYTVPKGTNAVDRARDIVTDVCGLECAAVPSDKDLATARTYGDGVASDEDTAISSWLGVINDLLGLAGYAAARTDPRGTVILEPYVEPAARPLAWTFEEGPNSGFLPQVEDGDESTDVHNVVVVISSTADHYAMGVAVDEDPDHPYSVPNVGYEYVRVERTSDELTDAECEAQAARYLAEEYDNPQRYKLTTPYKPIALEERMALKCLTPPIDDDPVTRTEDIDLGPACMMDLEAKSHG